jgi:hypothetical protein
MKLVRGLLVIGCALLGGRAAGDAADDGAPRGMVAFFGGGPCPTGWVAADYAQGRLVVAVTAASAAGVQVGASLGDREDRAHAHSFVGNLPLMSKSVSGADGGNNSAAQAQSYAWSNANVSATSGLPFVQLAVCEKQ